MKTLLNEIFIVVLPTRIQNAIKLSPLTQPLPVYGNSVANAFSYRISTFCKHSAAGTRVRRLAKTVNHEAFSRSTLSLCGGKNVPPYDSLCSVWKVVLLCLDRKNLSSEILWSFGPSWNKQALFINNPRRFCAILRENPLNREKFIQLFRLNSGQSRPGSRKYTRSNRVTCWWRKIVTGKKLVVWLSDSWCCANKTSHLVVKTRRKSDSSIDKSRTRISEGGKISFPSNALFSLATLEFLSCRRSWVRDCSWKDIPVCYNMT